MSGHTKYEVPVCVRQTRSVPSNPSKSVFISNLCVPDWASALRRVGRIGIPPLGIPRTTFGFSQWTAFGFSPMDSLRVFHPPSGNASTDPLTGLGSGPRQTLAQPKPCHANSNTVFFQHPWVLGQTMRWYHFRNPVGLGNGTRMVPKPVGSVNHGTVGRVQRAQGNSEISDLFETPSGLRVQISIAVLSLKPQAPKNNAPWS